MSSLQRRRKSQKSGAWTNSPLRELSSFLGSRGNSYESAPDPLLSPFLCSISVSDGNQQDKCSSDNASFASDMKRYSPPNSWKLKEDLNLVVDGIWLKIKMFKLVGYIWISLQQIQVHHSDESFRLCLGNVLKNNFLFFRTIRHENMFGCQMFPKQVAWELF